MMGNLGIFIFCVCIFGASSVKAESLGHHAKSSLVDGFDSTGIAILVVGAGATAIAFNQDAATRDTWVNYNRMNSSTANFGNFWGTGIPEAAIALGQLAFDNENGWVTTEGLLSSFVVVSALKFSSRRSRPDSDSHNSFPSGHTQVAFSLASSLTAEYGWWVGVPFIGLGILTGLSRLSSDAHWLSDVVGGATVGAFFGRSSLRHHMTVAPYSVYQGLDHEVGLAWRMPLP